MRLSCLQINGSRSWSKNGLFGKLCSKDNVSCVIPISRAMFTVYCRHPHIYGIDLASPSELIAHHRDEAEIANHVGAAKVIFQKLSDLEAACAEQSPREHQQFEVGVFCGSYATPVEEDYFEHLDRIRGKSRKLKILENAREAVVGGFADARELQIAVNGIQVADNGEVIPSPSRHTRHPSSANSHEAQDDEAQPRDRMDIALHNLRDYPRG